MSSRRGVGVVVGENIWSGENVGVKRWTLAVKALWMSGDQRKCVRIGEVDSVGHMGRMRSASPKILIIVC